MIETILPALFWLLSFGAIAWMFIKFREAQRVLVNANPAAHLTDLQARLQISHDELARSELARQQIEPTKIELEQLQLRRQAILDEISSLEGQKQNLLQELQNLQPEKQQLEQTRQAHAKAMEELADARQKHSDTLKDTEVMKAVLGGLQETKQITEQAIGQKESRLDQLNQQVAAAESQLMAETRRLEAVKHDLEMQIADVTRRIEGTKLELKAAEANVARMREEYSKTQAARDKSYAEFKDFEAKAEALRKAITSYEALLKSLQSDVARHTGNEAVDPAKALEDLAKPALSFNFSGQSILDENGALRKFSEYLGSKGLHYPERVQRAFHTSLKASQINPLVVLAGVSGTGKSALPMAYAEALGINFVSLAVQPGWSGPQDLLGFYNYLERKYKATELARAMVQMSRFSHEDLPGLNVNSKKDEMLLVLLDEMNLARIEYYFSDFLSRLEQRRGRNLNESSRRRDVSLLLDIGGLPANEAPRFIFPDTNVLFVGTMNEDESTQSLSDKVVDRANVLRFGAPKDLHAPTSKASEPLRRYLPRTTWEGWIQSFDGNSQQGERKLLSEINNELEKINRPFGHRVYRAILDYVANYPGISNQPERRNHALSDQIEQKIIPKLRGLETEGETAGPCLEFLANKIGGLNDPELKEAFQRARSGHMFEWHGVKRT